MKTRLTELLKIEHPVMLAGMGGVAYSELAAAVSNAGGYGCLGASTMSSERLAKEIAATKDLTSKPFGVDQHVRRRTRRTGTRHRPLSRP